MMRVAGTGILWISFFRFPKNLQHYSLWFLRGTCVGVTYKSENNRREHDGIWNLGEPKESQSLTKNCMTSRSASMMIDVSYISGMLFPRLNNHHRGRKVHKMPSTSTFLRRTFTSCGNTNCVCILRVVETQMRGRIIFGTIPITVHFGALGHRTFWGSFSSKLF